MGNETINETATKMSSRKTITLWAVIFALAFISYHAFIQPYKYVKLGENSFLGIDKVFGGSSFCMMNKCSAIK